MADVGRAGDRAWADLREAASDASSGAAEISRRAADALAAIGAADREEAVRALVTAHPSMAPLWRLGSAVLGAEVPAEAAAAFASALVEEAGRVATAAAPLLPSEVVVHSCSSTVIRAVREARVRALCAVSEPGGEGRIAARRLREAGVEAAVVDDREARRAVAGGTAVVTGADAIGPGGIVNKVGTRALAQAARHAAGACYVLAGGSKLLAEDLPAPEPFERTPLQLVTAVVGEDGAGEPVSAARNAVSHPLHPALRPVLADIG
jgi:translation initiation factor 2B subunit (eIF-2B alpha/beta/delta family)